MITPFLPGSFIPHAGVPKLPPITLLIWLKDNIWFNKATVVDFPFVPVIPITLALGFVWKKRSISFTILVLFFFANLMASCWLEEFIGIPGVTTKVSISFQDQLW